MTERKVDLVKFNDFDIARLILRRNILQYEVEQIDELLNRIGVSKGFEDAAKKEPATENKAKEIALPGSENISKLPWKNYQTKETAKSNEAAWIFANTQGLEVLIAELKTHDKVLVGSFEYAFSGKEHQFISRKPLKA